MPKDTIIDPEWELEQQRRLKETLRGTEEFASGLRSRRGAPEEDVVVLGEDVPEGAASAPAGSSAGMKEEGVGPDTSGASAASPDRDTCLFSISNLLPPSASSGLGTGGAIGSGCIKEGAYAPLRRSGKACRSLRRRFLVGRLRGGLANSMVAKASS